MVDVGLDVDDVFVIDVLDGCIVVFQFCVSYGVEWYFGFIGGVDFEVF